MRPKAEWARIRLYLTRLGRLIVLLLNKLSDQLYKTSLPEPDGTSKYDTRSLSKRG